MSGSVNKVILVGRVGKDPEIRSLSSGDRVASLRLATSESWRDKSSGERKEKTEWHSVSIFNDNIVRVVEQYVTKGAHLYIEGQLQTRKWQDKDGQDRYTTEVVIQRFGGQLTMLGGKKDGETGGESYGDGRRAERYREGGGGGGDYGAASGGSSYGGGPLKHTGPKESFPADLDDEIPF